MQQMKLRILQNLGKILEYFGMYKEDPNSVSEECTLIRKHFNK